MYTVVEPQGRNERFKFAAERSVSNNCQLDLLFVEFFSQNMERSDQEIKTFVGSEISLRKESAWSSADPVGAALAPLT